MDNDILISYAKKAMGNAYAPYSGFSVGAALLSADGEVFTGCNVENSSFGATICAERCAVLKAVQFLSEFMEDGEVILCDSEGNIKEYSLDTLIPFSFTLTKDM